MSRITAWDQLKSYEFKKSVESLSNELKQPIPLSDAIDYIVHNQSWSPEHEEAMVLASDEEYIMFFKKLKGTNVAKYCKELSVFNSPTPSKDSYRVISKKIDNAFNQIASSSLLNKNRVCAWYRC